MSLSIKVGVLLRQARVKAGLKQREIASRMQSRSMTASLICRYEKGFILPGFDRLRELLEICGQSVPSEIETAYCEQPRNPGYAKVKPLRDHASFVRLWQESDNVEEVAAACGISHVKASQRAVGMRMKGVPLKHMKRAAAIDWESLSELAQSLRPVEDVHSIEGEI